MKRVTNTVMALAILCLPFFFLQQGYAQSPAIQWHKSLGGSGDDFARSVVTTADGGYISAGYSTSNNGDVSGNHGGFDYWVVKTDASGNIQWQRSYGGTGDDHATSIIRANDNGYIIAGYSTSNNGDVSGNHGNTDFWVVKVDLIGNIQWQKSLGGAGWDWAKMVIAVQGGGYLVTGASNSNNGQVIGSHGSEDNWIVRLDNNGILLWQKCLGGSQADEGYAVVQAPDGGFAFAGFSSSSDGDVSVNHGIYDYWIVKTDANGNIQWQKPLGGSGYDFAFAIQTVAGGGYIVSGQAGSNDGDIIGHHGSGDAWTIRLDANGNILWKKSWGGSADDAAYGVVQTGDAGFLIAGYATSNDGDVSGNHGGRDLWLAKMDASGNLVWQKTLGGSADDAAFALIAAQSSGFVVAGYSYSNNGDVSGNHGAQDFWLAKVNLPGVCSACPQVSGFSATGFRSTARLQWSAYSGFTPLGYYLYRSTTNGVFGSPARVIGAYDEYTDYGLSANTTYYYKIAAFDAAGNTSPISQQIVVTTNTNNYLKVASLDLLIPIYTGGMEPDEPAHIRTSLEFARLFYFRNTKAQLNLKFHFMEIAGFPPPNADGVADFGTIATDLETRGIQPNQYDAIHIEANQLYGYYGGGSWLGQTGASMGHAPGYTYDEDNHYTNGDAWLFTHEFGHTLDGIIAGGSGFPEMLFNHFPWAFPLPAGVPSFDAGPNFDGMALVLRYFNHHLAYAAPWDGYLEIVDADTDGLPDNDARLPDDEFRWGSSPFSNDSDQDGLSDKEEFLAGYYRGSNPNASDTDSDGIPDNTDIYPLSNFNRYLGKTSQSIAINGTMQAGEGWQPLASHPAFSETPSATLSTFATWDNAFLYFAFQSNTPLKYYLNLDGSGEDGVFASPIRFPGGNYADINDASYGDSYYENAKLIIRSDSTRVMLKNAPVNQSQIATTYAGGLYTTEVRIPHQLGPGFGYTYTPPGSPIVTTQSYSALDTIGIDLVAMPLQYAVGNELEDWSLDHMISLNDFFHYYDVILTAPPIVGYCPSVANFPWEDWISRVQVGAIDHPSGKSPYSDFTAISTNLTPGSSVPVSLTTGFSYFTFSEYWKIWIDYNQNGVFEEPAELAFNGIKNPPPAGTPSATLAGSIQVPLTALTGTTRMRISMKRSAYATPCETLPFGEVEDYSVVIQAGAQEADLSLMASASPDIVSSGSYHLYVVVNNQGPTAATNITVKHYVHPHFAYYPGWSTSAINNNANPGGAFNTNTHIWTIPSLEAGGTAMLDLTAYIVDADFYVENDFFEILSSSAGDPDSEVGNDGGARTPDEDDEDLVPIYPVNRADFAITTANSPSAIEAGNSASFSFTLKNVGSLPPFAPFQYKVGIFLSENSVWDPSDLLLMFYQGPLLNPDSSVVFPATITIPSFTTPGSYHLLFFADYENTFFEHNENNNLLANSLEVTVTGSVPYCNSYSNFPWHEWIAGVSFGSINHPSGKSPYSDFTSLSTSVNTGQTYPVQLTTGFSYFTYPEFWRIWIDYNKNGQFESGEIAFTGVLNAPPNGTTTAMINGQIAIPANAPTGSTRMRISMKRGDYASPCEILPFGEVEDYTIQIGGGSQPILQVNCPGDLHVSVPAGSGGITGDWNAPASSTTCSGGVITTSQTGGPQEGSFITPGTYFIVYQVTDQCGNMQTCSFVLYVEEASTGCQSYSDFPWHDWISRVKIHTLDNSSGKSPYSDYTGLNTTLVTNTAYAMTLSATFSWDTYDEYWKVWIDYNHNGVFEEPGEVALQKMMPAPGTSAATASVTGTVNLPVSALSGATRMRVSMKRGAYPGPCEVLPFGEVEDYTIVISSGGNLTDPADREADLLLEAAAGSHTIDLYGAWYQPTEVRTALLEKSTDGRSFFPLYEAPGEKSGFFDFADTSPAERFNHYRLTLYLDNDEVVHSPVRTVSFAFLKDLTLFPNPASTVLNVHVSGEIPEGTTFRIYDASGREMQVITAHAMTPVPCRIDVGELLPGYYVLYAQREGMRSKGVAFVVLR